MSDRPDTPPNQPLDEPPIDPLEDTNEGDSQTTRAAQPAETDPTRTVNRPISADDVPPVAYTRPPLSRKEATQILPPEPPHRQADTQYARAADPNAPPPARAPRRGERRGKARKPPRQPRDKRSSGLYLPWWSLVLMLAFVGCVALASLALVTSLESNAQPGGGTPLVIVITSTFTVGPPASPTAIPIKASLTPSPPLPTVPPTLTLPPGDFAIGETVKVVGVGDSSLNVRSAPGTDSTVKFRALDGETYVLKDGPQQASSDEWWFIQDLVDSSKGGWASRRFLTIAALAVPTPAATAR